MRLPGIPRSLTLALTCALAFGALPAPGATYDPITHDGLPLVPIPSGTNAAQARVIGQSVVFSRQNVDLRFQGFFVTRGEVPRSLVPPNAPDPAPGATRHLRSFEVRFDVSPPPADASPAPSGDAFVFAAGESTPDALYRYRLSDATLSRVLAPGTPLPHAEGRTAIRFGPPHLAGEALAVVAGDNAQSDIGFQGVYRVLPSAEDPTSTTLVPIADTATPLPGPVGKPAFFTDTIGFDGSNVVFQAAQGPFEEPGTQGLFHQSADGTITPLLSTGDPLPEGGTVDWLDFSPIIHRGILAFIALDTDERYQIVRLENGQSSLVARTGDPAPDGGTYLTTGLGGLVLDGSRTVFAAVTTKGPGLFLATEGHLTSLVTAGRFPLSPTAALVHSGVLLHDVKGSALALQWTDTLPLISSGLGVVLPQPSLPVFVAVPAATNVPLGGRIELRAPALGEPPLRYLWSVGSRPLPEITGDTLTLDPATGFDTGEYQVVVTNAFGSTSPARAQVNVEAPPVFLEHPASVQVNLGDGFQFRTQIRSPQPSGIRWQKDDRDVANPAGIPSLFSVVTSQLENAGTYRAIATNAWGSTTSSVARLSLLLPAPNPDVDGHRVERLFTSGISVSSAGLWFLATNSIDPAAMRWLGDRLALAAANPDGVTPAVFTHAPTEGGLEPRFLTGGPLPNGLGLLQTARVLPAAHADDPLVILGGDTNQFRGLYRIDTNSLVALADTTRVAPGAPGLAPETFTAFPGPAAQAGSRVAFLARTATRTGVFLWADDTVRRLVDSSPGLPAPGPFTQFTAVGFDGETAAVVATGTNAFAPSLLRVAADGTISVLLKAGDPVPGTATGLSPVAAFETLVVEDGAVFFACRDFSGRRFLCRWQDGSFRQLAAPGTVVPGIATIIRIEPSPLVVDAGRAVFTARLATPGAPRNVIVAATAELDRVRVEPLVDVTGLDAESVSGLLPIDLEDGRLAFYGLSGGQNPRVVVYANTGLPGRPAPQLVLESVTPTEFRLRLSAGALLEAAGSVSGPWEYVPAQDTFTRPRPAPEEPLRFFRLRWP